MRPIASTLSGTNYRQVIDSIVKRGMLSDAEMESGLQVPVRYDDEPHTVQVQSIGGQFEDNWRPLLLTISSTSQYRESYQNIVKVVVLAGLFATFLALILSYFFSNQTLKPVGALATAAEEASHGKYSRTIDISGKDQLTKLGSAINRLLSDLREKQDMQNYLTQISHLIPDEQSSLFGEAAAKRSARIVKLTILAIDTSPVLEGPTKASELQSGLETITQETNIVLELYKGDVYVDVPGQVICAFEGQQSDLAAYAAAIHISQKLAPLALNFKSSQAKFAITEGSCLAGTYQLPAGIKSYIYGGPIKQAIRLLQESNPGDCLATNNIYQGVKDEIDRLDINVDSSFGALSGKRFCSLPLSASKILESPTLAQREETTGGGTVAKTLGTETNVLKPGGTIVQRYEILAILGEGSMGSVFKARDKELDSMVAIKVLRPDMAVDDESFEQMKSEIKLARQITHQNILRTYDLGDMAGTPFITMEYVRGLTLRNLIANTGKLPYSAGLRVARQLCSGLQAVHDIGVLHRDIKPENIIIELNGNVKLMDFGISRSLSDYKHAHESDQGMFLGTPRYASPEQMLGQALSQTADIYSCGVVLTELFTGKVPIEGSSFTEISESHVQNPPIPPNVLWPGIPIELDRILLKCLAKNPRERYASADELLGELNQLSA